MDRSDSIDRALSSLKAIEAQHQAFVSQFSNLKQTRTGSISSLNGTLNIVCFGMSIQCRARPVMAADESAAYEYQFSARALGDDIHLVRMYLTHDGHISSPNMHGSRVCDFNNQYISDRVSDLVANAMLRSAVFSPKV